MTKTANYIAGCEDNKLDNTSTKIQKEKLRYQINWIFLVLLGMLDGVNYTAMTTTFHQYVINPRRESLGNQSEVSSSIIS